MAGPRGANKNYGGWISATPAPDAGQPDTDTLVEITSSFENAAIRVSFPSDRAAPEAELLRFRSRPDAVPVALHVLRTSVCGHARFQAATAIRTLVREGRWPPGAGRATLRDELVHVALGRNLETFERRAVLAAAATAARKYYPHEPTEVRAQFFGAIANALADPTTRNIAAYLVRAVVDEFLSPDPCEPRSTTRIRFARSDLPMLFTHAAHTASLTLQHPQDEDTLTDLLSSCASTLSTNLGEKALILDSSQPRKPRNPPSCASLGRNATNSWIPVLQAMPSFLHLAFTALDHARNTRDFPLATATMTCLIHAAGIHPAALGSTPSDAGNFVRSLTHGLAERHLATDDDWETRLAYAETWSRLVAASGGHGIVAAGNDVLDSFVADTVRSIVTTEGDGGDGWEEECRDLLLETWAAMVSDHDTAALPPVLLPRFGAILRAYVDTHILNADRYPSDLAYQEEEEDLDGTPDLSVEEARLEALAVLIRAAVSTGSVHYLAEHLRYCVSQLRNPSQEVDQTRSIQDRTYWLVRLSGWVLADSPVGETPMAPASLIASGLPTVDGKGPGTLLFEALMAMVELERDLLAALGSAAIEVSPLIGSALCDALARISPTYLTPEPGPPTQAAQVVVSADVAAVARRLALKMATKNLLTRGHEPALATSSTSLLVALASGGSLEDPRFRDLKDEALWRPIAFSLRNPVELTRLRSRVTRELGHAVASVYVHAISDLTSVLFGEIRSLCLQAESSPSAADQVIVVLNLLRGMARCRGQQRATRDAFALGLREILLQASSVFTRTRPDVPHSGLKLLEEVATNHLVYMSAEETSVFYRSCVDQLDVYAKHVTTHPNEVGEADVASASATSLKLLLRILDKDAVDFGDSPASNGHMDVGEVVLFALSNLLPAMTAVLLEYPKVNSQYFRLVTELMERHPEKLTQTSEMLSSRLFASLESAMNHADDHIVKRAFEALAAVASWNAQQLVESGTTPLRDMLEQFLGAVLKEIMSGGIRAIHMDVAADAMMPLMGCDGTGEVFLRAAQAIISESGLSQVSPKSWVLNMSSRTFNNSPFVQELSLALFETVKRLVSSAGSAMAQASIPGGQGRQARKQFRARVQHFSDEAHGLFLGVPTMSVG